MVEFLPSKREAPGSVSTWDGEGDINAFSLRLPLSSSQVKPEFLVSK